MKQRTARLLQYSGALRLLDAYWGSHRLTVLAYHRITDATQPTFDHYRPNVSATPAMFEQHMAYVAQHFNVIDLDALHRFITAGEALPVRPLLITFDDGYLDNYANAFPILRAHHLPAVIFLMTSRMDQPTLPWWDECAYYFQHTTVAQTALTQPYHLDVPQERTLALEAAMRKLKLIDADQQRATLNALAAALKVDQPPAEQNFLSWDQARELVANGITCQPHTVNHPRLSQLDEASTRREIAESGAKIETETGQKALAFAYPFGMPGDFNPMNLRVLRESGIDIGFTLSPGPLFERDVRPLALEIPRILVEYRDSFGVFRAKLAGIQRFREKPTYLEEGSADARLRD